MYKHIYIYLAVDDHEYEDRVNGRFFVAPPEQGEVLNFTQGWPGFFGSDFPKGKYRVQEREHDGIGNLHLYLEPKVP